MAQVGVGTVVGRAYIHIIPEVSDFNKILGGVETKLTAIAGGATGLIGALTPAIGLVGGLGAAFGVAGAGAGAFFALAKPQFTAINQSISSVSKAQDSYNKAIAAGNQPAANKALQQRNAALKQLDPAQRQAAESVIRLKDAQAALSKQLQPQVLQLYTHGVGVLGQGMHAIAPLAGAAGTAFAQLAQKADTGFAKAAGPGGGLGRFLNEATSQIPFVIGSLGRSAVNLGGTLSNAFDSLLPAIGPSLTALESLTSRLKAAAGTPFANFIKQVTPLIQPFVNTLGDVGHALTSLVSAAVPLAGPALSAIDGLANALGGLFRSANFQGFVQNVGSILSQLTPLFNSLAGSIGTILNSISGQIAGVMPMLVPILSQLGGIFAQFIAGVSPALPAIVGLAGAAVQLLGAVAPLIPAFRAALVPILDAFSKAVIASLPAINQIVAAILPLLPLIGNLVAAFAPLIPVLVQLLVPGIQLAASVLKILIPIITPIIQLFAKLAPVILPLALVFITVSNPLLAFGLALTKIGLIVRLFHTIIEVAWKAIQAVTKIVWDGIKIYFTIWWTVIKTVVTTEINVIKAVIKAVWSAIQTVWHAIWDPIKNFFVTLWHGFSALVKTEISYIKNFISDVLNGIKAVWNTIWNAIKQALQTVWNVIKSIVTVEINGVKNVIMTVVNGIKAGWDTFWHAIKSTAETVMNAIKAVIDRVLGAMRSAFDTAKHAIKVIWDGLQDIFKVPINFVIGIVNRFDGWIDNVTDKIGLHRPLPENIPKLAGGGQLDEGIVRGPGGRRTDSILARLSRDEHVTNADSADGNRDLLLWMDRHPGKRLPGFVSGGDVGKVLGTVLPGVGAALAIGGGAARTVAGDVLSLAFAPIKALLNNVPGLDGLGGKTPKSAAGQAMDQAVDWVKGKQAQHDAVQMQGNIVAPGSGVQRWAPLVLQALTMNGLSPSLLPVVLSQMSTESGGNPNIVQQVHDVNSGPNAARGLMQVIPTTFQANHFPGTSWNIFDPLANIAAGLKYAKGRYGPGLSFLGHGHGYGGGGFVGSFENGGVVPRTGMALVHAGEVIANPAKMATGGPVGATWHLNSGQITEANRDLRLMGFTSTRQAQQAMGIQVDGILGPQTWGALRALVSSQAQHSNTIPPDLLKLWQVSGLLPKAAAPRVFSSAPATTARSMPLIPGVTTGAPLATARSNIPTGGQYAASTAGYSVVSGLSGTLYNQADAQGNLSDISIPLTYGMANTANVATDTQFYNKLQGDLSKVQSGYGPANAKKASDIAAENAAISTQNTQYWSTVAVYSKLVALQKQHGDPKIIAQLVAQVGAMNKVDAAYKTAVVSGNAKIANDNSQIQTLNNLNGWISAVANNTRNNLAANVRNALLPAIDSISKGIQAQASSGNTFSDIFSVQAGYGATTASQGIANLQAKVNQTKAFVQNLRVLAQQGLDPSLLADLANAGADSAGSITQALMADPGSINAYNALESQLQGLSAQGGQIVGNAAVAARAFGATGTAGNLIDPTNLLGHGTGNVIVQGNLVVQDSTDIAKIGQAVYQANSDQSRAKG